MPEFENINLLKEELLNYFFDKRFDLTKVVDFVCDTIEKTVDCDINKLIGVLSNLRVLKKEGSFFAAQNKIYDISSNTNKISVKEIMNGSDPILFFYNGDESLPFLKIITSMVDEKKKVSIETSNSPELLTSKKGTGNESEFRYIFKDIYLVDKYGNIIVKKYTFAKSGNESENLKYDYLQYNDLNVCKFSAFLDKILSKYANSSLKKLSSHHLEFLDSFYRNVASVMNNSEEFKFIDLIDIIESVLFDENNGIVDDEIFSMTNSLSNAAENIASKKDEEINFDVLTYSDDGNPLTVSGSRNNKFLSLKISDSDSNGVFSYLICETTNGFTLFRNVENSKSDKNVLSSFTLNLSDNILKFSALGNSSTLPSELIPIDLQLIFKDDGSFGFYCENAAQYSNNAFEFGEEKNCFKMSDD